MKNTDRNRTVEVVQHNEAVKADLSTGSDPDLKWLSQICEVLPNAVQIFDRTGNCVYQNPAINNIFGLGKNSPAEDHSNIFTSVFHKHNGSIDEFVKCLNDEVRKRRVQMKLKPGSERLHTLEQQMIPLKNSEGKVHMVMLLLNDLTEKLEQESQLHESEERFRAIFKQDRSVKLLIDPVSGSILDANQAAADFYGYSMQELTSLNISTINQLPDNEIHTEMQKALDKDSNYFLFEHKLKNGQIRNVEVYSSPLTEGGRELLFSIIHDVTEKVSIQKRLQESEIRFDQAMQAANDGLWDWNLETDEIYLSDNWKRMLGYEPDELPNEFIIWESLTHPEDRIQAYQTLNDYMEGRSDRFSMEMRMLHKNGEWRYILSRARFYQHKNGPKRLIGTHVDMTQNRQLQRELERINKTKDTFFSIIAHDIRSPFSAIQGLAELSRLKLEQGKPEDAEEYIGLIDDAVRAGNDLLNNLLEWSRLQNSNLSFNPCEIIAEEAVTDAVTFLKANADRKNITILAEMEPEVRIWADDKMLATILRNLISNAIKFSQTGGAVSVTATRAENGVSICVQDQGVGIPPERQKTLFGFGSVSSTEGTDGEKGSGLGLVLCSEFMQLHNGNIEVHSKPGETRFMLHFPDTHSIA